MRIIVYEKIMVLNHHSGLDGDRHFELGKEMSKIGVEVTVFMSAFDHQKEDIFMTTSHYSKNKKWSDICMAPHSTGVSWKWCEKNFEYDFLLSADAEI